MKRALLALIVVSTWLLSPFAKASPLSDDIDALKTAMKKEDADKSKASPSLPPATAFLGRSQYLMNLGGPGMDDVDNPNVVNALQSQINQILTVYSSPEVQKAGQALLKEIQDERKARQDAYAADVKAVLARVPDTISKATKPADLDALLVDLQKVGNPNNGIYEPATQQIAAEARSAYQFTCSWQDYLSALTSGRTEDAKNSLRTMSQNQETFIPRSSVLAKLGELSGVAPAPPHDAAGDIFKGIKTLDEMEPALEKIKKINPMNSYLNRDVAATLGRWVAFYYGAQADWGNINDNFYSVFLTDTEGNPDLGRQVLFWLMQHHFSSFQGPPPAAGEKPEAYVDRVLADAESRQDWHLLRDALEVKAALTRSSPFSQYMPTNSSFMDSFLTGLNQETAGQYTLAVMSYEAALKASSPDVPTKAIGDHLAAIQKDHPKEYAEGVQLTISPPAMSQFGLPGYPPLETLPPQMMFGPHRQTPAPATSGVLGPAVLPAGTPVTPPTHPPPPNPSAPLSPADAGSTK